jgi:methyl-accepting chemotaxis protein
MRRGAASAATALAERAKAGGIISGEASRLAGLITKVTRALSEQALSATEIAKAAFETRKQSGHVAKTMSEQARAVQKMTAAATNVSRQITAITRANREHSITSAAIVNCLSGAAPSAPRPAKLSRPKATSGK